jgi:serine racemase
LFSNLTLSYLFCGTIGGGLISGVAVLAAKAINHSIRILAAQPKAVLMILLSPRLMERTLHYLQHANTIADGLGAFLGDLTW